MNGPNLEILWEMKDNMQVVLSPAVGVFSHYPQNGTLLTGGSFVGTLKVLNTLYHLHLPGDAYGRVIQDEEKELIVPVQYGQELFRLKPALNVEDDDTQILVTEPHAPDQDFPNPDQGFIVTAFTTGIFYAKPSPDSPPFVTVGQEIEKGKALGLIEVMKTFNHIVFQGTDTSTTGKIKNIYVKDADEVKNGQPLFLIE